MADVGLHVLRIEDGIGSRDAINRHAVKCETLRAGCFDSEHETGQRVGAVVGVDDGLIDDGGFVGVVELHIHRVLGTR